MINLTQNEVLLVSGGDLAVTVQMSTEGVSKGCIDAYTSISDFKSHDEWLNIINTCTLGDILLMEYHYDNGITTKIEAV